MTLDQLPAGLPMDDKIEAWVQRAMVLSRHCQDAWGRIDFGEQDNDEAERAELEAHLRTTPEGFVLMPIEWTDEQQTSAQEMLNVLRGALGENLSDETMIGAIYDGMTAPFRKLAASQESGT